MKFTLDYYKKIVQELRNNEYSFSNYSNYKNYKKTVIIRHDIDFSLKKALSIAHIEHDYNISSTYFLLLTSDFYNVFSLESISIISKILNLGHEIGLHFDETRYIGQDIISSIYKEILIFEKLLNQKIKVVSMHRPSTKTLESNYVFDDIINSYGKEFFVDMEYVSDSRRLWKIDLINLIQTREHDRIHLLTHPIWYSEHENSIRGILDNLINEHKVDFLNSIKSNIRDSELIFGNEDN